MATTIRKQSYGNYHYKRQRVAVDSQENGSEWGWMFLSLILFVLLGPFSSPIVLYALFKVGQESENNQEPELLSSE